jgi:nitroreductase
MLTDMLFTELVKAASLAPSADNMQPWEFRKQVDTIEVYCAKSRILPTDVIGMFAWVSVGAAIQNIVEASAANGFVAKIEYSIPVHINKSAAIVRLSPGITDGHLANWIALRTTNRNPYEVQPLDLSLIDELTHNVHGLKAGVHWNTKPSGFECLALMDANSTYIRLEHKPLHDELFDILRFTHKEIESARYGLTFESLEVPSVAVFFARQLQFWAVTRAISRLGIGRLVAKKLSSKLRKAGALCLVTANQRNPIGYMEAGRAMEKLWLAARAEGLSVQPYGVLPQYLTKVEIEPETFLQKHAAIINSHHEPFFSIFPEARNEYPAIVLRIGRAKKQSSRSNIRLRPDQIINRKILD